MVPVYTILGFDQNVPKIRATCTKHNLLCLRAFFFRCRLDGYGCMLLLPVLTGSLFFFFLFFFYNITIKFPLIGDTS